MESVFQRLKINEYEDLVQVAYDLIEAPDTRQLVSRRLVPCLNHVEKLSLRPNIERVCSSPEVGTDEVILFVLICSLQSTLDLNEVYVHLPLAYLSYKIMPLLYEYANLDVITYFVELFHELKRKTKDDARLDTSRFIKFRKRNDVTPEVYRTFVKSVLLQDQHYLATVGYILHGLRKCAGVDGTEVLAMIRQITTIQVTTHGYAISDIVDVSAQMIREYKDLPTTLLIETIIYLKQYIIACSSEANPFLIDSLIIQVNELQDDCLNGKL
jgi:hypothetical protein